MKYHLPERIVRELCSFAQKYSITRIVLFGSRARGTNAERSDIDIAVYGGDFDNFYWDVADSGFSIKCEMSPLILISCAASSRTCQHVAVHRTAKYAVQEPTCF